MTTALTDEDMAIWLRLIKATRPNRQGRIASEVMNLAGREGELGWPDYYVMMSAERALQAARIAVRGWQLQKFSPRCTVFD